MAILSTGFVHTVFFWMKNPDDMAEKAKLLAGLHALSTIEEIKIAYVGSPADTNRPVIDSSYDFSISFVFDNAADQNIYQTHPKHLKFIEDCSYIWSRVQVYDAM